MPLKDLSVSKLPSQLCGFGIGYDEIEPIKLTGENCKNDSEMGQKT